MVERLTISRAVVEKIKADLEYICMREDYTFAECIEAETICDKAQSALEALNESMAAENVKMRGAAQWADKCGQIFIYIDNEKITVGDFVRRIQQDAIACNPEPRNGWQPRKLRNALEGLVEAVIRDSKEQNSMSGYTGARLSDAEQVLKQIRLEEFNAKK